LAAPAHQHDAQVLTPLTAEFWSPERELRYRESAFGDAIKKTRLALFIGGATYFALILIDALVLGLSQSLAYCLAIRSFAVAIMILDYVLIARYATPRAQDVFTTVSAITVGFSEIALLIVKGQDILHHGITALVAVLAFYLFIPFGFANMLLSCISMSVLFLAAGLFFLSPGLDALILTTLLMACINLFGAFSQHRQNTLDRRGYLNLETLTTEVAERALTEKRLKNSEAHLEELFRSAPAPLMVVGIDDGKIKIGNKAIASLLDVPYDHLTSFSTDDFGISQKVLKNLIASLHGTGSGDAIDLPIRSLHKDPIDAAFHASTMIFHNEDCVLLNATDVTALRKQTNILRTIAEGFAGKTGIKFLDAMTAFLHQTTGCDWTFIGELEKDGETVHSLSYNDQGAKGRQITYKLKGAPCERVMNRGICVYRSGVSHDFPEDIALAKRGAEGYAGIPLFDSQGTPLGLIVIFGTKPLKDVETVTYLLQILAGRAGLELEAIQAEEKLKRSQERLSVTLKAASEFMYTWDVETDALQMSAHDMSRFQFANPPKTGSEWISRLHPEDQENVRAAFRDHVRGITPSVEHGYRLVDDNGDIFYLRVHALAVRNKEGKAIWIAGAVVDMTESHKTQRALAESEERYRELVEASPDAIILHHDGNVVYANPATFKLLGIDPSKTVAGQSIQAFIESPYDKLITKRLSMIANGHRHVPAIEIKLRNTDGELLDVDVASQRIMRDNKPMVQSVIRDISAKKRAEAKLRESEEHHKALFNNAPVGIFVMSKDGGISQFNENWADMLGYADADGHTELLSKTPVDITHPDDKEASADRINSLLTGKVGSYRAEKRWLRKDGTTCWGDISVTAIHDENEEVQLAMVVVQDVTERKEMEEELRRLATTDSLTGASNRRHFMDRGEEELHRAKRYGRPLAILAMDLDHFKNINDTYGHSAGDAALQHFTLYCMSVLREEDVFGRIGGEEFAVVLPEGSHDGAVEAAERIRVSLEENPFDANGTEVYLSVSIGVAACPTENEDCTMFEEGFQALLARADKALYAAKDKGRNRVEVFVPEGSGSKKKAG